MTDIVDVIDWKSNLEDTISETPPLDAAPEIEHEKLASKEHQSSEDLSLEMRIEALLFVSSAPVTVGQLATALEIPSGKAKKMLEGL